MDNKMELARYKATMYNHIHLNVGVVDFLRELFTNNKPLLFSEREIPIIISHIIGACDKVANTLYYKAKLLDFLRVLLVFNSKSIRSNQLLVLQKLQDDQFSNIMVDLSKHLISSKIESSPPSLRSFEESISIPS
jgi:inositol 1,4,5-triphosphate receptor type 1/inositol 1,4,5-triphosphate receptor type 3